MISTEAPAVSDAPTPARRRLLAVLRLLGLIGAADLVRRARQRRRDAADNAAFLAESPDFAAPPLDFVYEVTGRTSLRTFAASGRAACAALAALADTHLDGPPTRVLDWGVGPARVARWWPALRPGVEIHGADPWEAAVRWSRHALPAVRFTPLEPSPPTPFDTAFFDLAYGVSILTHLPEGAQRAWLAELRRIVRPGGLLALTLQGNKGLSRLTPDERRRWDGGEMVVRARVKQGSRLYLAYHPPAFARRLFSDWEILRHEPNSIVGSGGQDLWMLRRPAAAA
jgi:SAM-dependent methyltransferase